jgi:hypothetical protein
VTAARFAASWVFLSAAAALRSAAAILVSASAISLLIRFVSAR